MAGKKGKRKAASALPKEEPKRSKIDVLRDELQCMESVNVSDLSDGFFMKQRYEMNEEQRGRYDKYQNRRQLQDELDELLHAEKWDENKQFKPAIINPAAKNKELDGSKMKGYTVWRSHQNNKGSYAGEIPSKEFDSTWGTSSDANARARFLFYWKNEMEIKPEEVSCNQDFEIEGLKRLTHEDEDGYGSTWTVGVVPDVAFKFLDGAEFGEKEELTGGDYQSGFRNSKQRKELTAGDYFGY